LARLVLAPKLTTTQSDANAVSHLMRRFRLCLLELLIWLLGRMAMPKFQDPDTGPPADQHHPLLLLLHKSLHVPLACFIDVIVLTWV
jgi:hypothetical protein